MNKYILALFVVVMMFLAACSKAEVSLDQKPEQPSAPVSNDTAAAPPANVTTNPTTVSTEGKTATGCDDTDLDDKNSPGRVRITYDDKTTKDFYDECPGEANFETEYVCNGNDLKAKNYVCKDTCLSVVVKDTSCPGCKVGFCSEAIQ